MTTRRRVLVVEDDETLGTLIKMLLDTTFDVELVHTLAEAGHRIKQEPFLNCVLLDLMLPNGLGIDLLNEFENENPAAVVPIVVLSGYTVTEKAVLSAGAQALLNKPVNREKMIDTIVNVISDFEVNRAFKPAMRSVEQLKKELAGTRVTT